MLITLGLCSLKFTSAEEFTKGNANYVVPGEEWTSMQPLAETVPSGLGDPPLSSQQPMLLPLTRHERSV
ncbi:unnamed protein product [Cylicocyclus nassatus]|uniref:Uncharacterized protein n=1 Tax=Cylicocyclus nassatus TaxID=53992 RepID=A0AA36GV51_CYLNA|nr:unnamed protein product [Cylicocyclus nassatus]